MTTSGSAMQVKESQRYSEVQCSEVDELIEICLKEDVKEVPKVLSRLLHSITVAQDEDKNGFSDHDSATGEKQLHLTKLTREQFSRLVSQIHQQHCHSDVAMAMLGLQCMAEEEPDMAEVCLQSALRANPDCLMAAENLRMLQERTIYRWHFRMLNDLQRNSAYSKAIGMAVEGLVQEEVPLVLDIGCGTGLLSMMCVQAGVKEVWGVEVNQKMVEVCEEVLRYNGMTDKVQVLHHMSTSLLVPNHIPRRAALVVTEIVDAGLLGEHIVPTLRHAWKELLLPPAASSSSSCDHTPCGHVIPSAATIYATAIECVEIRKKSQLLSRDVMGVCFEGVALEGSCKAREGCVIGGCSQKPQGEWLERETYSCERLSHIKGGYAPLTPTLPVLQFDFTNPEVPLPSSRVALPVTRAGRLDAIVVWFDLHLLKDILFSTSPSWDLCWEQAIFSQSHLTTPPQDYQATPHHNMVGEGDGLLLYTSSSSHSLHMEVCLLNRDETIADGSDGVVNGGDTRSGRGKTFFVERDYLLRLNDRDYVEKWERALEDALLVIKGGVEGEESDDEEEEECVVMCVHQGLSVCGLAAAKLGANFALVLLSSPGYTPLLETLGELNGVKDRVSIQQQEAGYWCHAQLMWDLLVCELITPQGVLCQGILEKIAHVRETQFHPSSLVLPSKLVVMAMLVSSPSMRAHCSVLGSVPTLGAEVAPVINMYQISHFVDVDVGQHQMQLLAEPFQIMHIDLNKLRKKDLKDLCGSVRVPITCTGPITGIVYWFHMCLHGDVHISTAPSSQTHWHQSVFMLQEDLEVVKGTTVTVTGLVRDSYLQLSCSKMVD